MSIRKFLCKIHFHDFDYSWSFKFENYWLKCKHCEYSHGPYSNKLEH